MRIVKRARFASGRDGSAPSPGAESLPARLLQAEQGDLTHREFLELLVEDELEVRRDRLFARRLRKANLPCIKTHFFHPSPVLW
jgi:hypothetical protein